VTLEELHALPPTLNVEEAARLIGCGRTACFESIRRGDFPVPVLRIGTRIKIPTRPLLELLGIAPEASPP
jgi:hypothetical protein